MLIDSEVLRTELRRVRLTDCTDPDAVVLAILDKIERETDTGPGRYSFEPPIMWREGEA